MHAHHRKIVLHVLRLFVLALCGIACLAISGVSQPANHNQPARRDFPPLQVPAGFTATLFASDPIIQYPSVIACGPRANSLLVAIDTMTGLGHDSVTRDEIRLLEDTDGDGAADKATVVAGGFNSIQGLAYHDGTIFVMHSPYLSSLRFSSEAGKAEGRQDLLTGLGLPPEKDQVRLHNANGVVLGHDGWLYLALGDRGCVVDRPEGDRLNLHGGGILRCRPDGRDLHVFSTGFRNIYDVALDEELNVFVRDNENDGGAYKTRVCHSFFGADHGYPYLFADRPGETMPPLADVGLGSSAGGLCYLETAFPAEYRGNLFFCEWGRAVMRYVPRRAGASFAALKEIEFAAGVPNDPYGFKPTDLVVTQDGALFVSDWADGQRPRRGRGRIYRIAHRDAPRQRVVSFDAASLEQLLVHLDSENLGTRLAAQHVIERRGEKAIAAVADAMQARRLGTRGRLHGVWIVAKTRGMDAVVSLMEKETEPRVQAQHVRALADAADPVLATHRLEAGRGDAVTARRLADFAAGKDPRVQLEAMHALGRLRWPGSVEWLRKHVKTTEPALLHAAQMTMRRAGNWPAVLNLLDAPSSEPLRAVALRAAADQHDIVLIDGLLERLQREQNAPRRAEYADLLARVFKKPGPWIFWGYRPGPRPVNSVAWDRTDAIATALGQGLASAGKSELLDFLHPMLREGVRSRPDALARCLTITMDAETVTAVLDALASVPAEDSRTILHSLVRERKLTPALRVRALQDLVHRLAPNDDRTLLALGDEVVDGPVLSELLRALGRHRTQSAATLVQRALTSADAEVRAGALVAVEKLGLQSAKEAAANLLDDEDSRTRAAAIRAVGALKSEKGIKRLPEFMRDTDEDVRRAVLDALAQLRDPRGVPLAVEALERKETTLAALDYLAAMGGPAEANAIAQLTHRDSSAGVLAACGRVLIGWLARQLSEQDRDLVMQALADIHGTCGVLLAWHVRLSAEANTRLVPSNGMESRVRFEPGKDSAAPWLAHADFTLAEPAQLEFFTASTGLETIRIDDVIVFERKKPGVIGPYADRFEIRMGAGRHRIQVHLTKAAPTAEIQLRFRRKSTSIERERLAHVALSRAGNPEQGRQIFLNPQKGMCAKCHRIGDQGERVGPDLTGVGARFAKAYLIDSILEPSRTIAPSFDTRTATLANGRIVQGILIEQTPAAVTLVDSQAQKHVLSRVDIESLRVHPASTMPEGFEKRLSEDEFVDLISFLVHAK